MKHLRTCYTEERQAQVGVGYWYPFRKGLEPCQVTTTPHASGSTSSLGLGDTTSTFFISQAWGKQSGGQEEEGWG